MLTLHDYNIPIIRTFRDLLLKIKQIEGYARALHALTIFQGFRPS